MCLLKESHQVGHGVTNSISTSAEAIEIAEMLTLAAARDCASVLKTRAR
jgi:hypothetical protein